MVRTGLTDPRSRLEPCLDKLIYFYETLKCTNSQPVIGLLSIRQSVNQSVCLPVSQSTSQSFNMSVSQPINQSINQSISQPIKSINQPPGTRQGLTRFSDTQSKRTSYFFHGAQRDRDTGHPRVLVPLSRASKDRRHGVNLQFSKFDCFISF